MRYYKCLGRKHNSGCKKSAVRKEFLEEFVLENIIKLLNEKEIKDKMISALMLTQEITITNNSELHRLIKERKTTETQITNIMTAIESGGTSATAMKRMRELERKADDLEKAIAVEQTKTTMKYSENELRAFYEEALKLESQLLINVLIKQITLYDDKMIIIYNSPIKTGPDESRDFSLYNIALPMPYGKKINNKYNCRDITVIFTL